MDKETYLKKWSKKTKKSIEELEEIWERAKEGMERVGITDERAIMGSFRRKLRGIVYRKGKTKRMPEEFFGFVYGASRLIDWDEIRRNSALKAFNADPKQAILDGLVDESGNPLDDRDFIYKWGKKVENPNFRKPLVGHSYDRKVFGIAKREKDDEPKVFRLNLRGKTAKEYKGWKPFVPVRFLALVYGEDPFFELYPSQLTRFTIDKKTKLEIEKWIRTVEHVYQLDKLDQAYDASKDAKDKWVFIEADLDYIDPSIDEDRKQRSLSIADDSVGFHTVRVRIPADFPINFSEFSRVIVMGEVQKFQRRDGTPGEAIEGYGVYPLPGKSIKMPEKRAFPAEAEEEQPIVLWD